MNASVADIVNMAIGKLGLRAWIDDINDATPEAETAHIFYEMCRNEILEAFPWNFATKRATLAALTVAHTGYAYAFLLPSDALTVQKVESGDRNADEDTVIPFAVEYDASVTSQVLLCDIQAPEVVYTFLHTDTVKYPAHFVNTLAWRLATEMAHSLTGKMEYSNAAHEGYRSALARAIAFDSTNRQVDRPPDSEFIRTRG